MRAKDKLLDIFIHDQGGVQFERNPLPRLEGRARERHILEFLEMSRRVPSRSIEDFCGRLLRRGAQCMPLPGAPHERLTVTDYGSGGSSGAGPVVTAATSAAAAATHPGNTMPWVFPSSDFIGFQKYGTVSLPASGGGAISTIISFKVPNGRYGKISALGIDFVLNASIHGFTQGVVPAQLQFVLAADGVPFQDFGNFNYLPGTASNPLAMPGLMLREGQKITLTVQNLAITADSQFVEALIQGYYYSKNLQPKVMGYQ